MAEVSLKRQTFHSTLWKIFETGGTQFIQFLISIVLARLVMPDQFSAIAMMSIFIAVANVFIDAGFTQALIRKTDRRQIDCCTVFYTNIAIAVIAYLVIFAIAPFVADFYNLPEPYHFTSSNVHINRNWFLCRDSPYTFNRRT